MALRRARGERPGGSLSWERVKTLFQEAVSQEPREWAALLERECGDDPEIRQQVERLLKAHRGSEGFLETPVAGFAPAASSADEDGEVAVPLPARIGPYRVLSELGRGGMGTVYLAEREDEGFRKTVAVKVVRRGMDSAFVLRRFRTERRILAALEHPGIARLYDGGTTEDGLPYFVMEYVPGESLLTYCDARTLPIAERLRLFRRVCNAVQFAHQALVVHRDLKPSNVLVTPQGNPKLLDFGIAKLLAPPATGDVEEATATLLRVMTPGYASPEQVRGGPVTTASDVYSLGVILYELLSGQRPYRVHGLDAAEVERVVTTQEAAPPSAAAAQGLRRALRGDLDNIVLKALQKDPVHRYATAAELADDIGRHLDGRPVHARPDRRAYRAAKFIRRHRLAVAAATAAVIALAAGLAVALWQARVARAEREVAQRRFSEARRLIHTVIFDIQPKLGSVPGATALRKTLIDETLQYLEALARDAGDDNPAMLRELVGSYRQLARLQGDATHSNVGDMVAARATLGKAEVLAGRLLAVDPDDPGSLREAASVYLQLATQSSTTNRSSPTETTKAETYARRAVELAERRVALRPHDAEAQSDLADALFHLALASGSIEVYDRSRTLYEALLRERPDDPRLLRNVALVHKNVASLHYEKHDYRTGLEFAVKAREIDERVLALDPANPTAQMDLAIDFYQVNAAQYYLGDVAGSVSSLEQSIAMREKVLAQNPDDARALDRLAFALSAVAGGRRQLGDAEGARRDYERAFRIYTGLHARGLRHQQSLSQLAMVRLGLARIEKDRGRLGAACVHYRESVSLYREVSETNLREDEKKKLDDARRGLAACGG